MNLSADSILEILQITYCSLLVIKTALELYQDHKRRRMKAKRDREPAATSSLKLERRPQHHAGFAADSSIPQRNRLQANGRNLKKRRVTALHGPVGAYASLKTTLPKMLLSIALASSSLCGTCVSSAAGVGAPTHGAAPAGVAAAGLGAADGDAETEAAA